ncbi:MAG: hypothetical protein ACYDG2_17430, partial [Ruminiclostridium sp.]
VKMLEERVAFQLQEITSGSQANHVSQESQITQAMQADKYNKSNQVNIEMPKANISGSNKKIDDIADISAYEELAKKIDIKNAVYFMLKLKADFGSYEKVFDEYLYSLQADLDLNDYIKDKKAYLKKKEEKNLSLYEQKVITLEKIEEKSIEMLQKDTRSIVDEVLEPKNNKSPNNNVNEDKSPLPDVPRVEAEDVKPKNPTDEVMNEIKEINPIEN